ncbi:histidine phosphatase family protein [Paenibacillus chibensis]|uniref:Histidine phosphatase family protein n=1 Tax=Paenibacillus chibensis TaxID=59846 RepID=A0ABU6PR12_9BACL|nr:histidine phosphatase family protein [Paenibacillus chibensis]
MNTVLYLVRHADSQYVPGSERSRPLSEKGLEDAQNIKALLCKEPIDAFYSSPYRRAVQTVEAAAAAFGKEVILIEDLRERTLAGDHVFLPGDQFYHIKKQLYDDFAYACPGGESSSEAQRRGASAILELLDRSRGQVIAVGTHGDIMTLILNFFDPAYHFEFWASTSMPDMYRLVFEGNELVQLTRCWPA